MTVAEKLASFYITLKSIASNRWVSKNWFFLRVQTGYFLTLHLSGNIKTEPQLPLDTLNRISRKNLFSKVKKFAYLPVLFLKIKLKERAVGNFLKTKTLHLGYQRHNIKNGSFNMYLHPFYETKSSEIFYLDLKHNSKVLTEYFQMLTLFYQLLYKININKTKSIDLNSVHIEYCLKQINAESALNNIIHTIDSFKIKKRVAKRFLKVTNPKDIQFYCFYNPAVNAFVYAANQLNIQTVEYQHSVISASHYAYNGWENIESIKLHFPTIFYLWGESEKKIIESNFLNTILKPEIKVTGNVYLKEIKETQGNAAINWKNDVLICLQGIWIPYFLEEYILNDTESNWYFRLHPRYPNDKEKLSNLCEKKKTNVIVDSANTLELYDLFTKVSTVVTSFSGTALEAENFSKKVVIFGEMGYAAYKEKIDSGLYDFISADTSLKNIF